MHSLFSLWSLLFGLIIGSFLNVCIYRLPRGQSIVVPRSYCPDCGRFIHWYDNIPVLSFLILGGHCRACKRRIPIRYPLVELLTGVVSLLVFWKFGAGIGYFFYFVLFAAPLIAITFIDLDHRIIPDLFSISGIFSGIAATIFMSGQPIIASLLFSLKGILVGGGALLVVSWLYEKLRHQEGIGGGDIKLTAMFGAFFGWKGVFLILLLSSLMGSVIGLVLMIIFRKGLKLAVPFGPFLAGGAFVYLFFGTQIITWYIGMATGLR